MFRLLGKSRRRDVPVWYFLVVGASLLCGATARAQAQPVSFNRDIRPLLSDHCFQCHGPDEAQRKADLRLDTAAGALAKHGDTQAISPGDLDHSEVWQRLISDDPELRMPPAKTGRTLTNAQRELIRRWILDGAKWEAHWSWIPPQKTELPVVQNEAWCRSPLDRFVLQKIEQAGLAPAPEADRITWLRRVTLDLTGLPPTPAEADAFLADQTDSAYETVVQRLLQSPRYGERMAVRWLDGARYADTNGYQSDGEREMWRWRDWVIDAYNRNQPFDQFTIEQLAGDMLPEPTLEQRIATGFNRNHRGNAEGGIVPEEYAVEYVVDRVDTTFTVWLGLTMGCARCHDHKFDPLSQRDYYQTFALFNNVPEKGRAIKFGNSPPVLSAPTTAQQAQAAELQQQITAAQQQFTQLLPALEQAQHEWEARSANKASTSTQPAITTDIPGLLVDFSLDEHLTQRGQTATKSRWQAGTAAFTQGKAGLAALFDGTRFIEAGDLANFGYQDRFTCALWVRPAAEGLARPVQSLIGRGPDAPEADGWSVVLAEGKVQVRLTKRWLDDALRVETLAPVAANEWQHLTVTYDGSRTAAGVGVFVNGARAETRIVLDELNQTTTSKEPLRIGGGSGPESRFVGALDEIQILEGVRTDDEIAILATAELIPQILAVPVSQRTAGQRLKLAQHFLQQQAPQPFRDAATHLQNLQRTLVKLRESYPTVMVMEELPQPRVTHVLLRGEYDKPGERVAPGIPGSFAGAALPANLVRNRLEFAQWLVRPDHPLTARVAVNRLWQMLLGQGIVRTVDDFGSQGTAPTHPELLDWLAVDFTTHGWDQKRLIREIVLSATYRQSSRPTAQLLQVDPENLLLARGPRQRLAAEMIRDQALAASGLLQEQVGGPSVFPYQPAGLWTELTENATYTQDSGANLYRRGLYTFWKRTIPPPGMMLFDAAGREACMVRETRTNTPLQALNLMNDITYLNAARQLAMRAAASPEREVSQRLTWIFRQVLTRPPATSELEILTQNFAFQKSRFEADPTAATRYLGEVEVGTAKPCPPAELAALTAVAQMLLNLDETVTKR